MLARLVQFALAQRLFVLLAGAVLAGAGVVTTATGGSTTVVMSTGRSGVANARRNMIGGASS